MLMGRYSSSWLKHMECAKSLLKLKASLKSEPYLLTNSISFFFLFPHIFLEIHIHIQEQHQWSYAVKSKKSRRKERFE